MKIKPKKWEDYQHYKHRNPPWIRLHKKLLDDFDFQCLHDASKVLAMCLWLLASEYDKGEINLNIRQLLFRLRMEESKFTSSIEELKVKGFIVVEYEEGEQCLHDASTMLAQCYHDATTETETETEKHKSQKLLSVSQAKADPVPYDSIITSANQILGKKFRATDKHKSIIRARWNEGFREDDFAKVCSTMLVVWGSDPKMQAYLRPETLFGTKMDSYLNMKPVSCNKQRSKSEEWRDDAQSEINAFINGRDNAADNRQQTGFSQIRSGNASAV